jgi:hypothetical protein
MLGTLGLPAPKADITCELVRLDRETRHLLFPALESRNLSL